MADDSTPDTTAEDAKAKEAADAKAAEDAAAAEEAAAAEKRSEAAKKAAVTRAANQKQAAIVDDLYKHLRHTIGAEVSIDQARQIVETVQAATAAE